MPDSTIVAAFIGLGGAVLGALLVVVLQPIWTNKIGPKARLVVRVEPSSFALPRYLAQSIEQYRALRWNPTTSFKPGLDAIGKLEFISRCSGYLKITLQNKSNRALKGIKVTLGEDYEFVADCRMDGHHQPSKFTRSYEIETLLPRSEQQVAFWTYFDLCERTYNKLEEEVYVTAMEIDNIDINYVNPKYVTTNNILIRKNLAWRAYWTVFLAGALSPVFLFVYEYAH